MTREEAKSCICTIEVLGRLCYRVHGLMDDVDAQNCKKLIEMLYGICDSESELPPAQPKRQRGKWIDCNWSVRCSECDYSMPWAVRNFCPNCGADMRGKQDE